MSLKRLHEIKDMPRSLILFENSIHSEPTRYQYKKGLEHYMQFVGFQNKYDDYIGLDSDVIQKHLEDYIIFHNGRNIKRVTIKGYLKPVYLFLDSNRVRYFQKPLNKMIRKDKMKKGNNKPYTDEDIEFMKDYTNSTRDKSLILFFSSIGGRPRVLIDPVLRFRHLYTMPYGCKAVLLYADSDEEYWGFLTPEASKAFDLYRDERLKNGENLTPNSPLFVIEKKHNRKDNHLTLDALYSIFLNIIKQAPIERIKVGNRYDKALLYGFRKRFNTILKIDSDVNSNIAEKLMAHKKGLDGVYLSPTRDECFAEFVKAIPQLTISKAEKLSLKLEKSESEKDDKIKKLESEMKEIYQLLERISPNSI